MSAKAPDVLRGAADEVGKRPGSQSAFGTACKVVYSFEQKHFIGRCWLPLRRRASWTLSARRTVDNWVAPKRTMQSHSPGLKDVEEVLGSITDEYFAELFRHPAWDQWQAISSWKHHMLPF